MFAEIQHQRAAAAEQARSRLVLGFREWSDQREALTTPELGVDPLRLVPAGWPGAIALRQETTARDACVIDHEKARAESSRLLWSATAKLAGAAVSLGVPLALLIAVVGPW